jgi:phytoene desaturase
MDDAKFKYETSMNSLIYTPGKSILEFAKWEVVKGVFKLNLFSNFKKFVRKSLKDEKLTALMDFPVLFLGSAPENTPALYSLMNYAGLMLGTWYPENGMYRIIESMEELAIELGVKIHTNAEVSKINVSDKKATSLVVNNEVVEFDAIIAYGIFTSKRG